MHVLDIIGEAGDQPAGRLTVEKAEIQAKQVGKQVLAHAVHDRLPHPFQHDHLGKGANKNQHHQKRVLQDNTTQSLCPQFIGQVCGQDVVINAALHELRHNQRGNAHCQGQDHRNGQGTFVAGAVAKDAPP